MLGRYQAASVPLGQAARVAIRRGSLELTSSSTALAAQHFGDRGFASAAWAPGVDTRPGAPGLEPSGRIPEGLEGPGATVHQPERSIHQTDVLIQGLDPRAISRGELDLRCRQVLAQPCGGD